MSRDPKLDKTLQLLRELILSYTRYGDSLTTTASRLMASISFTVQAHADDHPKIVGAKGQHILALQTVFLVVGKAIGLPIRIILLAPAVGEKQPFTPFQNNLNWKPDKVMGLMRKILDIVMRDPYGIEARGDTETVLEISPGFMDRMKLLQETTPDKNDFANALQDLFHAIGKSEGRIIHIDVVDPKVYANQTV